MLTTGAWLIIASASLIGSFVSGIFGMAGGQIFLAVALVFLSVAPAIVVFASVQVVAGGWRALLWRRYVHWGVAWRYVVGSLVACVGFLAVNFVPSKPFVYLGIGLMPFAAFALPKQFAPDITRRGAAYVCGFFMMTLQLVVGQAGNILDVFFQASPLDRKTVVATKAVTQLVAQLLRILYFGAFAGNVFGEIPPWVLVALIGTAIGGTSLATFALERMTDQGFRKWTKIIIACFSAIYVARGLWLLWTGETD